MSEAQKPVSISFLISEYFRKRAIRAQIAELRNSIRYVTFADDFDDMHRAQYVLNILKDIRWLEKQLK